mgnify:CR=1 FL=1
MGFGVGLGMVDRTISERGLEGLVGASAGPSGESSASWIIFLLLVQMIHQMSMVTGVPEVVWPSELLIVFVTMLVLLHRGQILSLRSCLVML